MAIILTDLPQWALPSCHDAPGAPPPAWLAEARRAVVLGKLRVVSRTEAASRREPHYIYAAQVDATLFVWERLDGIGRWELVAVALHD